MAIAYEQYLAKLLEAARQLWANESDTRYPACADNGAKRALVDFSSRRTPAVEVDTVIRPTKPDSWVGSPMKERLVKNAIKRTLPDDFDRLDDLFELVKARSEYR